jgi:hypothetical protein
MTELAQRDFDALVAVDWDVAMLRRGFEEQLSEILETFAYAAPRFLPVDECEGSDQGRQVWFWWDRYWKDLLGARQPYDVFNACQIFRRDLVDRFVADPEMPRILEAVDRARVIGMEEFVYPTRTVSYGFPATSLPGGYAIVTHLHDYDELELLSCDRAVHLVHKIATSDQRASVDYLLEHQGDAAAAARRIALRPFLSGRRRVQIRTDLTRARMHLDVLRKGP